jgi:hypothetical protein
MSVVEDHILTFSDYRYNVALFALIVFTFRNKNLLFAISQIISMT